LRSPEEASATAICRDCTPPFLWRKRRLDGRLISGAAGRGVWRERQPASWKREPAFESGFDLSQRRCVADGKAADQLDVWHGSDGLNIEGAGEESGGLVRHFVFCASQAGGACYVADQGSLFVLVSDAEDEDGAGLLGHTEIDQPDLAAQSRQSSHC